MKKIIFDSIYKALFMVVPKNKVDTFIYDSFGLNDDLKDEFKNVYYTKKFKLLDVKQIRSLKSANIVLIDNYYHPFSIIKKPHQTVYQLWHANGAVKNFGLTKKGITCEQKVIEQKQYSAYDFILVSSKHSYRVYRDTFGVSKDKLLKFGYLQTDKYNVSNNNISKKLKVFYAPTFRENGDYSHQLSLVKRLSKYPNIDFKYSLHPHSGLKKEVDVAKELQQCNVFISDYSSLVFDALYLNKAVYLYQYDLEAYTKDVGISCDLSFLPSIEDLDISNVIYSGDKFNEYNKGDGKDKLIAHIQQERKLYE